MNWCGAIMAASGFTWCYTMLAAIIAQSTGHLTAPYVEGLMRLGYLIVILPIIGSGIGITIESWAYFYRRRSFGSGAVAGWNSFAQIYNVVTAMDAIPDSLGFLGDLLKGGKSDKDNAMARLMIILAVVAAIGGILTAIVIIRMTARSTARSRRFNAECLIEQHKARERMAARKSER